MSGKPVDLDDRRTAAERVAVESRRHCRKGFEADRETLLLQLHELEAQFLAEPADSWRMVAAKAQYLIQRYAETAEGRRPRRRKLIDCTLSDIARFVEREGDER